MKPNSHRAHQWILVLAKLECIIQMDFVMTMKKKDMKEKPIDFAEPEIKGFAKALLKNNQRDDLADLEKGEDYLVVEEGEAPEDVARKYSNLDE